MALNFAQNLSHKIRILITFPWFYVPVIVISFAIILPKNIAVAQQLNVACGPAGKIREACISSASRWANKTKNEVFFIQEPQFVRSWFQETRNSLINSGNTPPTDLVLLDSNWAVQLSNYLINLNNPKNSAIIPTNSFFPSSIKNNSLRKKLFASPWTADASVLFYRKDLLKKYEMKVPTTWENLESVARKIQRNESKTGFLNSWGLIFAGETSEHLTTFGTEWIWAFGGEDIVNRFGVINANSKEAQLAISSVAKWINEITPHEVTQYTINNIPELMKQGKAVFAIGSANQIQIFNKLEEPSLLLYGIADGGRSNTNSEIIKGDHRDLAVQQDNEQEEIEIEIDFTPLVRSTKSPQFKKSNNNQKTLDSNFAGSVISGQNLAIPKLSTNQDLASQLMAFMVSSDEQKRILTDFSLHPAYKNIYSNGALNKEMPWLKKLGNIYSNSRSSIAQNIGNNYPKASAAISDNIHSILLGKNTVFIGFRKMEKKLSIIRGAGW